MSLSVLNGSSITGTPLSTADPLLGGLANNGGPTSTLLPSSTSPALAIGTKTGAPATDQRGVARTAVIDIGAVQIERIQPTAVLTTTSPFRTAASVIRLAVTFSKPVSGLSSSGVVLGGTSGAKNVVITPIGTS
jgi:hypothetical protein